MLRHIQSYDLRYYLLLLYTICTLHTVTIWCSESKNEATTQVILARLQQNMAQLDQATTVSIMPIASRTYYKPLLCLMPAASIPLITFYQQPRRTYSTTILCDYLRQHKLPILFSLAAAGVTIYSIYHLYDQQHRTFYRYHQQSQQKLTDATALIRKTSQELETHLAEQNKKLAQVYTMLTKAAPAQTKLSDSIDTLASAQQATKENVTTAIILLQKIINSPTLTPAFIEEPTHNTISSSLSSSLSSSSSASSTTTSTKKDEDHTGNPYNQNNDASDDDDEPTND